MQSKILAVLSFVAAVSAHGKVLKPAPRVAGDAFKAACGATLFNTEKSDPFGNIQGLAQQAKNLDASKCDLSLCKGYQFADNAANVHSFAPGEKIDFTVEIRAPHTGVANCSLVETGTNSVVGAPLISFENYASTKTGIAPNNTAFSVTLPNPLPANCGTAGNCVIQWWWDSAEAGQTYMSCVDFTSKGGSSSGSPAPGPAPPAANNTKPATPAATPSAPASESDSSCTKRRSAKRALRQRIQTGNL